MSALRVFTAEFQQERKAIVKGFTQKSEAVAWAQERIADESIASIALWELTTDMGAKNALAVAAEGKPWYTLRHCFMVVTRRTVRRVK
jgi:hypothetical protein